MIVIDKVVLMRRGYAHCYQKLSKDEPTVRAQGERMKSIVELRNVNVAIKGKPIIHNLNMSVPQGQVYGFLGRNGAGKTTVMKTLLSLLPMKTGEFLLHGRKIQNGNVDYLRFIGSLIEEPAYYPHLSAVDNLRFIDRIRGTSTDIDSLCSIVGLYDVRKQKVSSYSLGMKQRLGIASALVGDPEILLLDEPTNGLDPDGIREIRILLKDLAEQQGKTVIISSHLLAEIEQTASVVGIISNGRMLYEGAISGLIGGEKTCVTVGNPQQFEDYMRSKGLAFSAIDDTSYAIRYCTGQDASDFVKNAVQNSISIEKIWDEKRSLEESFLKITGEMSGR
ncbi:ATP-binding cassette domain-containing protein [Corynebacterium sp. sy039]|nr:ATP-binding cassette domain-containing protein [Corynebacterium sp. sy039]